MTALRKTILIAAVTAFPWAYSAGAQTRSPAGASVYIIAPADGATAGPQVLVQFGLRGMGVTQAGSSAANAGHHHLLIDTTDLPKLNEAIPVDEKHVHFGAGQTETTITLPPGRHTLQLVLGDANHQPFVPMLASPKVTINVVAR